MASDPDKGNLFERFKNKFSPTNDEETREHLITEIANLHKHKKLSDSEFTMLNAVLDFQGRMVREVMVPRIDAFMTLYFFKQLLHTLFKLTTNTCTLN